VGGLEMMNTTQISLADMLRGTPYRAYTYAYPHKTAYRPFDAPLLLHDLWAEERRDSLFLYFHVPFCEMRCGFCNLFTTANPGESLQRAYLDALRHQSELTRVALPDARFARMAIGGGTPTYLDLEGLRTLFDLAEQTFGVDSIPISVESSPLTAEPEKLALLREHHVSRISIGVQSFNEGEVHAVGRAQKSSTVESAIRAIRDQHFPTLNIDLIYGLPGQTLASWLACLQTALTFRPEELYLYPLYVRPLTGLDRTGRPEEPDLRLACYRAGRDLLCEAGYTQVSMRMFRAPHAPTVEGPVYCVQDDGMVGLGAGARSYTRQVHYASEYAVSTRHVRGILKAYTETTDFEYARHGFILNADEQRRRYVIKSILESNGLSQAAYTARFGTAAFDDLPLAELIETGLAALHGDLLTLTTAGIERSDTIGVWLYSPSVMGLMDAYEVR
jgi:oxygen-independent coproporphyrinogen-3 oxidase